MISIPHSEEKCMARGTQTLQCVALSIDDVLIMQGKRRSTDGPWETYSAFVPVYTPRCDKFSRASIMGT